MSYLYVFSSQLTAAVVHLPKRWAPPVMSALFGIQASFLPVQMYKNDPPPHSAMCPVSALCGTYLFGHFLIVAARTLILASNIICFPREYAQSNRSLWAQFSTSSNPLLNPQIKFLGEPLVAPAYGYGSATVAPRSARSSGYTLQGEDQRRQAQSRIETTSARRRKDFSEKRGRCQIIDSVPMAVAVARNESWNEREQAYATHREILMSRRCNAVDIQEQQRQKLEEDLDEEPRLRLRLQWVGLKIWEQRLAEQQLGDIAEWDWKGLRARAVRCRGLEGLICDAGRRGRYGEDGGKERKMHHQRCLFGVETLKQSRNRAPCRQSHATDPKPAATEAIKGY
ncbi:hypothetical protein B0H11DRAFT_1910481 [Mycena galericulata]|nr:hypothetical protein B0H11DRAFT_1910481 [Mycena galericulata]